MIKPQHPPYTNSTVDAYKTQGQISKMLKDYGAEGVQWTDFHDLVELTFGVQTEINGHQTRLVIKLTPPLFVTTHRTWNPTTGRHEKQELPNYSQSMRLLYHYLKAKLAAVAWGIRPFEEEFLAEIGVQTPTGIKRAIEVIKEKSPALLGLPEIQE